MPKISLSMMKLPLSQGFDHDLTFQKKCMLYHGHKNKNQYMQKLCLWISTYTHHKNTKKMIKEFKKCLIANYYKKCKMVQKSEVMPCELDIQ